MIRAISADTALALPDTDLGLRLHSIALELQTILEPNIIILRLTLINIARGPALLRHHSVSVVINLRYCTNGSDCILPITTDRRRPGPLARNPQFISRGGAPAAPASTTEKELQ